MDPFDSTPTFTLTVAPDEPDDPDPDEDDAATAAAEFPKSLELKPRWIRLLTDTLFRVGRPPSPATEDGVETCTVNDAFVWGFIGVASCRGQQIKRSLSRDTRQSQTKPQGVTVECF